MKGALKFKHTDIPRQSGELARLRVVQGPDVGAIFVVNRAQVTMGRGEEADIQLSDLKTSRAHAKLTFFGGAWKVDDLGSSNGILLNGLATRSTNLRTGDVIGLGESLLELVGAEVGTQILRAPMKSAQQIQAEADAFQAHVQRVRSVGSAAKSSTPAGAGLPKPVKLALFAALALGGVWFFSQGGSEQVIKEAKKKDLVARDPASYIKKNDAISLAADQFFKEGYREFREGNYLRAKQKFETVLQMSPGHGLALQLLNSSKTQIDGQVKKYLENGKQSMELCKLKEAQGDFASVTNLLYRDQSNPNYIEAQDQIKKIEEAKKGGCIR